MLLQIGADYPAAMFFICSVAARQLPTRHLIKMIGDAGLQLGVGTSGEPPKNINVRPALENTTGMSGHELTTESDIPPGYLRCTEVVAE
jgi:hypothetical protein